MDAAIAQIVERMALVGRLLHARGIFSARAGNISAKLPDGRILITRAGTHKALLDRAALLLLDAHGEPQEVGRPSSETPLHMAAYGASAEVGAVLHAHPVACTTLAIQRRALQVELVEEGLAVLGRAPLLAEGDRPLVASAWAHALRSGASGALLEGHGAIVAGKNLDDVLAKIELCEFIAELQYRLG